MNARQKPDLSPAGLVARATDELTSGVYTPAVASALVAIAAATVAQLPQPMKVVTCPECLKVDFDHGIGGDKLRQLAQSFGLTEDETERFVRRVHVGRSGAPALDPVARARSVLDGTSPGPWTHMFPDQCCHAHHSCVDFPGPAVGLHGIEIGYADAQFIAAARDLVPELADLCEALAGEVKSLSEHIRVTDLAHSEELRTLRIENERAVVAAAAGTRR